LGKSPLVSVIIPVFNGEEYISETIRSIQSQSFQNWELIITDDGSTDRTAEILKGFAIQDNRIGVLSQPNGGMGKARNFAISKAKGKYLAFIDADDLWFHDKLEKQLHAIQEESADLVYTSGIVFQGSTDNVLEEWNVPHGAQDYNALFLKQMYGFTVPVLSVFVRKECVTDVGGFEENKLSHFAADYQLWLRIMDNGAKFYGIDEPLFYYRVHEKQATFDDSLALGSVLWSLKFAKLNSISEKLKKKIMMQRLDRFVVHHADSLSKKQWNDYLTYYYEPLGAPLKGLWMKWMHYFGPYVFKRFAYRFLDLSENPNN
jgi:teichuronic acid biosynthesis glycosyltransferase TuaG